MREVAVVSFAQRQEARIVDESEVEFMVPLMQAAKQAVGLTQREIGFTCSGSSDFLAGQARGPRGSPSDLAYEVDGVGQGPGPIATRGRVQRSQPQRLRVEKLDE